MHGTLSLYLFVWNVCLKIGMPIKKKTNTQPESIESIFFEWNIETIEKTKLTRDETNQSKTPFEVVSKTYPWFVLDQATGFLGIRFFIEMIQKERVLLFQ